MTNSLVFTRFECNGVGIYEAVDKHCPRNDERRKTKPDGSWLPRVGEKFPGANSFWKPHGLKTYSESGLRAWHESVVPKIELHVFNPGEIEVLYQDDFQIIGEIRESMPWSKGALVDSSLAKLLVQAQFPSFANAEVAFLKDGWDSSAFRVGADHIFRFPKRQTSATQLGQERAALDLVASRLPFGTPNHELSGKPTFDYPLRFSGYRFLRGKSQKDLSVRLQAKDLDRLATFLNVLHSVSRQDLPSIVVETDPISHAFTNSDWGYFKRLETLKEVLPTELLSKTKHRCESLVPAIAALKVPQVLAHNDLLPEHILIDENSNSICGIIDWGDVAWTHATADLAGIAYSFGIAAAESVLPKLNIFPQLATGTLDAIQLRAIGCCISDGWYAVSRGDSSYLNFARSRLDELVGDNR
jgi:aminoglycoside phosphotransferase (APT) family kinase protein